MTEIAYIGLGSNLGDRIANIHAAIDTLSQKKVFDIALSNLYETKPVGVNEPQPDYINAVIRVSTTLTLSALHATTQLVEQQLGRRDKGQKKARPIDLDILLFADISYQSKTLSVPHSKLLERPFVILPLKDVMTTGWPKSWADIDTCCEGLNRDGCRIYQSEVK